MRYLIRKFAIIIRDKFATSFVNLISNKRICKASFAPSACELSFLRRPISKSKVDPRLINLTLELLKLYNSVDPISIEIAKEHKFFNSTWNKELTSINGEHYFLIELLCKYIKPKTVIEIGTFLGSSARIFLADKSIKNIYTFDIISWKNFPNNYLANQNKNELDKRFKQFLVDLSIDSNFEKYKNLFKDCDLILLDGPKNKLFEQKMFFYFINNKPKKPIYILVDDINLSTMVDLWNEIPFKKIDLSFIGHWSGSGLFIWE